MHILIVKHGALGDVVRTSYFAEALKLKYQNSLKLSWITSSSAVPLISFNPFIDCVYQDFQDISKFNFDVIYSLDDEDDIVQQASDLSTKRLVGAYFDKNLKKLTYTQDANAWFDMGLLSRFSKNEADKLKKKNLKSHAEIFSEIFETNIPSPKFWGDKSISNVHSHDNRGFIVGVNPYAGGRWSSKELPPYELHSLVKDLLGKYGHSIGLAQLVLFGQGEDRLRNIGLKDSFNDDRLSVADTDNSILKLANKISDLDLLITSDSLAMHLAIAQKIKSIAFFAPTSAVEIDSFNVCNKIISTSDDYCSYKKNVDNSSITSNRILLEISKIVNLSL